MSSMSKKTAPGMCAASYSARASRFWVGRNQVASAILTSGAPRCSASQAVLTSAFCSAMVVLRLLPDVGQALIALLEPARHRQALLAQEGGIEHLALVAVAVVAQHGHDDVARPELSRRVDRAGDVDAGRAAEHQPLLHHQIEDDRQRLLVRHLEPHVDRRAVQVLRDAALADAFGD